MIETIRKESVEFQNTVVAALEAMKARRQEAFASTRHGKDFEQAVYSFKRMFVRKQATFQNTSAIGLAT